MEFMKVSLAEIADLVQGHFVGDPDLLISDAAPFELAGEHDITVAGHAKFLKKIDLRVNDSNGGL